jgi:dihydrofolate reductase
LAFSRLIQLLHTPGDDEKPDGANLAQQCLRAGILEEIQIHLVPVLLSAGTRLFEHLGAGPNELERTRVVESPVSVTHLSFRVV